MNVQSMLLSILLCTVEILGASEPSPYPIIPLAILELESELASMTFESRCPPFSQAGDPLVEQPSGKLLGNDKILCVYKALGACMYDPVIGIYIPAPGQIIGKADSKDDCPDQLDSILVAPHRRTRSALPVAAPRAGPRATIPQSLKTRSELKRARK